MCWTYQEFYKFCFSSLFQSMILAALEDEGVRIINKKEFFDKFYEMLLEFHKYNKIINII